MSSVTPPAPTSKPMFWAGWVLTILVSLMLIMSGVMKLLGPEPLATEFARLGYPLNTALPIGIIELVCTALYLNTLNDLSPIRFRLCRFHFDSIDCFEDGGSNFTKHPNTRMRHQP